MTQNPAPAASWDKEGKQYPAQFDDRFANAHGRRWNALEIAELRFELLRPNSRCLEVGCGTGRFVLDLADRGHEAHGIDPSEGMIEIARDKTDGRDQVFLECGEGDQLPQAENYFDLTFAIRVTRHTPSKEYCLRMLDEMLRVTKPGGRIVVEFSNRLRPRRRAAEITFSLRELQAIFSSRNDVTITRKSGIMILSQGLYYQMPALLLPIWSGFDDLLSKFMPSLASYFYLTFEKNT